MLHIFLIVVAVMVFSAVNLALFGMAVWAAMDVLYEKATVRQILPRLAVCGVALSAVWTIFAVAVSGASDDSEHCGPGTQYVEHHVGKHTEWQCIAKED